MPKKHEALAQEREESRRQPQPDAQGRKVLVSGVGVERRLGEGQKHSEKEQRLLVRDDSFEGRGIVRNRSEIRDQPLAQHEHANVQKALEPVEKEEARRILGGRGGQQPGEFLAVFYHELGNRCQPVEILAGSEKEAEAGKNARKLDRLKDRRRQCAAKKGVENFPAFISLFLYSLIGSELGLE